MAETEDRVIGAAPAEAPEAAPAASAPRAEIPKQPYDTKQLEAIRDFFKKRTKLPGQYRIDKNGNLEIGEGKGKTKAAAGTIQLQRFVPLEPSEREAIEEARRTALEELDQSYEDEIKALRAAWEDYETSGNMRQVLLTNQNVADIDARRNAVRSAIRDIYAMDNPTVNKIILSDRYETRKMFGMKDYFDQELYRMAFYTFAPEVDQGKYVPDEIADLEEKKGAAEEGADRPDEMIYRQRLKDGRMARIFYDTDSDVNGFMSPMWVVDFTTNISGEIRYSSAIQAYEVERAKELGKDDVAANLLRTRAPRTIRLLTRSIKEHPKDARGLWVKIYTSIYEQHPNLKARLLDTGSDTLVFADVRDGPSGIGLSPTDSLALDPARWKGENAVGLAQETVRTRVREGGEEEGAGAVTAVGGSITEDDQKRAKVAAIINARRRH